MSTGSKQPAVAHRAEAGSEWLADVQLEDRGSPQQQAPIGTCRSCRCMHSRVSFRRRDLPRSNVTGLGRVSPHAYVYHCQTPP